MLSILIVEDDSTINNLLCEYLSGQGCSCRQAFSGTEGRLLADMEPFDLEEFQFLVYAAKIPV